MTDQEKREIIEKQDKQIAEFEEYCRRELPVLRLQEKAYVLSEIKSLEDTKKYWRLRETIMIFEDTITEAKYYPSEYYRVCMKLAMECLNHAKTISPEVHAWAYNKYVCMEMDFVGEAHCKVGTQYFPRYEDLAVGEEKQIWEEVIELGSQFHELRPEKI